MIFGNRLQGPMILRQTLISNGPPGGSRSFIAYRQTRNRMLKSLEQRANANLKDANAQVEYLQALNQSKMFDEVLHRCDSGLFSTNARVRDLQTKAIRALESEAGGYGYGQRTYFQPSSLAAAETDGQPIGTKNNPLHVQQPGKSIVLPLLALGATAGLIYYFSRGITNPLGGSKDFSADNVTTTFMDVCGCEEAKNELQDVVHFLSYPEDYCRLGGKVSRGILLVGPPGSGKTLMARAVAGEADVPFFFASGSDFEEMFVGLGASRMRNLFKAAAAKSPCIVFIDEIDAVGSKRNPMERQSMRQTINQLLVELDGFTEKNVIVIAATNVPDALDPALVRSGRFDRRINVPLPNLNERKQILQLYLSQVVADPDLDISAVASITPGASGADLANVVNMAAVLASKQDAHFVEASHLMEALETIEMGAVRKTFIMTPDEIWNTAYHESGHALMAAMTPGSDPIHKATIVPRGKALGMVMQKPLTDKVSYTRQQLVAQLDILMGGRVAEEVFNGEDNVTTGASNDMMKATQIARRMVQEWGYNAAAGLVHTPLSQEGKLAPATQAIYDEETKKILNDAYERAKKMISSHKKEMHNLAGMLVEKQTLTGDEISELLGLKIDSAKS